MTRRTVRCRPESAFRRLAVFRERRSVNRARQTISHWDV